MKSANTHQQLSHRERQIMDLGIRAVVGSVTSPRIEPVFTWAKAVPAAPATRSANSLCISFLFQCPVYIIL